VVQAVCFLDSPPSSAYFTDLWACIARDPVVSDLGYVTICSFKQQIRWRGGSPVVSFAHRGKIDFSCFISFCSTMERTGRAVRGGGSFAGGYRANNLAGHGGPSKANGRLPPPLLPFSSPCCPNLSPRPLLQTLATAGFLQILVDFSLVRSRQLHQLHRRSAQGGDHGPRQIPMPSSFLHSRPARRQ
jgi:hypothetical protein